MTDLNEVERLVAELVALGVSADAVEPVRNWVRDRRAGKPETVVYFFCFVDVGHFLWLPTRRRRPDRDDPRFGYNSAGPFKRLDGALTPLDTRVQSTAAIHHRDGWTALAMHDYSVDTRGGSNAVFVMDSDVSFEAALTYARDAFPAVVARIAEAAPITLVQTEGALGS